LRNYWKDENGTILIKDIPKELNAKAYTMTIKENKALNQ